MYALPEQSLEDALNDVRIACSLAPAHVSYYQLTLEPGTVFHSRPPPLPDEDAAWQIQCAAQELLAEAGYRQYEVSAYARDGARCRHNLNYWLFGDYLGLGAGAHGKLSIQKPAQILRTAKPKQPREYQAEIRRAAAPEGSRAQNAVGEAAFIAEADLPFEFMLNALRLNEGFTRDCFLEQTGLPLRTIDEKLSRARVRGLIEQRPDSWQPTELGRRFLNDLQASFLA
jgi:coproporphyrinogen III oxidase-like Fe-S oxidoreductase